MLKLPFPLLVLFLAAVLPAQERIRLTHSCSYDGEENAKEYYTFGPSSEADRIVEEICNAVSLEKNFVLKSSNVRNAVATMAGGKRVILYNTLFLEQFKADAQTRWAAYSVLAHEIGHHLNGHNFDETDPRRRKQMELEADRFSGGALRLLDAPLNDAKSGIETFAAEDESATHPPGSARREAIASGWKIQDERLKKLVVPTPPREATTTPDADGDGVPDARDKCPDEYGAAATGGCPDADDDGIADADDACKYQKGPAKWQGCPDSDSDGLPDHQDQCPNTAGLAANKGCPPADRDADGVPDQSDKCPDKAGQPRWQGCPDTDGDGIPDHDDKCPAEKGTFALGGCPEKTQPVAPAAAAPDFMVLVQGGTFDMGDAFGDGSSDEKPLHSVTVSSFYLGKTEVTFDEYDAFCAATNREKPSDSGWGRGKRPVINVTWLDAVAYCNWLSEKQHLTKVYAISGDKVTADWSANGYRLPTEAEWEYAARQRGQKVRFGNGKDIADPAEINFDGSEAYKKPYSRSGEYREKTVPVGSFAANSLGLYDMSGNVWEWCWDWYEEKQYEKDKGGAQNPSGPGSGTSRVVRGGSWGNDPFNCRASLRDDWDPGNWYLNIGFRVARH